MMVTKQGGGGRGSFCGDREIIMAAVETDGSMLRLASKDLRGDKEVVCQAVRNDGNALQHASTPLRSAREVVCEAAMQNEKALEYASEVAASLVVQFDFDTPHRKRRGDNEW